MAGNVEAKGAVRVVKLCALVGSFVMVVRRGAAVRKVWRLLTGDWMTRHREVRF